MANPKKGTSQARNEFIWGWAFILPTMLGLIILNIYPIFKTIYESFFKTGDFGKGNIFIGFDNYVKLFHDAEVWQDEEISLPLMSKEDAAFRILDKILSMMMQDSVC